MPILIIPNHPLWPYMEMHVISSSHLCTPVCTIYENFHWTSPQSCIVWEKLLEDADAGLLTCVYTFDIIWRMLYSPILMILEWYSLPKNTLWPYIDLLLSEEIVYPLAPFIPTMLLSRLTRRSWKMYLSLGPHISHLGIPCISIQCSYIGLHLRIVQLKIPPTQEPHLHDTCSYDFHPKCVGQSGLLSHWLKLVS